MSSVSSEKVFDKRRNPKHQQDNHEKHDKTHAPHIMPLPIMSIILPMAFSPRG
jgi:hypothetical protein